MIPASCASTISSGSRIRVGQILADLSCHIIALGRVDDRILIGVFLIYFFVQMLDEGTESHCPWYWTFWKVLVL